RGQTGELVAAVGVGRRRVLAGVERAVAVEIEIDRPAAEHGVARDKAALVEQIVKLLARNRSLLEVTEITVPGRGPRSQRVAAPLSRARGRLQATPLSPPPRSSDLRGQTGELVAAVGVGRRRVLAGVERAVAVEIEIDRPARQQRVARDKAALVEQIVKLLARDRHLLEVADLDVTGLDSSNVAVSDPVTRAR